MDRNVLRTFINCFVNVNFYTIQSDEMKGLSEVDEILIKIHGV